MSDTECEWCKPYVSSQEFYQAERHSEMHRKYAALKASHAELMQMLSEQGTSRDDGDGLCWCGLTSMIPYRGHDLNCKAVEAALKKAEGLK